MANNRKRTKGRNTQTLVVPANQTRKIKVGEDKYEAIPHPKAGKMIQIRHMPQAKIV